MCFQNRTPHTHTLNLENEPIISTTDNILEMEKREKHEKLFDDFFQNMSSIQEFIFGTSLSYAFFQDKYQELLKVYDKNEDGMKLFTELNSKIPDHNNEIYSMSIVNAVARMEAFLNDLLDVLFSINRKSLMSDKQLSYKDILTFNNLDDLTDFIKQKEILEFSHASFSQKLKFIEKRFNLNFKDLEDQEKSINEIFLTRNILLHNNGIINIAYLNGNPDSKFELGEKRTIDEKYTREVFRQLIDIGGEIYNKVLGKVFKQKKANK